MNDIKNMIKAGVEMGVMVFAGVLTYQVLNGAVAGLQMTVAQMKEAKVKDK